MVSIAECLLFVLDQCNPTGSASGTPTGNTARDPMLSSPVTHLAPVLAGLFLEVAGEDSIGSRAVLPVGVPEALPVGLH